MSQPIIDLRAETRRACSVLSDVFSASQPGTKYISSGIVADISESGLSITMDTAPSGDVLIIRNSYFEVTSKVRHTTPLANGSFKVGVAFTSAVTWKQPLSPTNENPPTPLINRGQTKTAGDGRVAYKSGTARFNIAKLLKRLAIARSKLGFRVEPEAPLEKPAGKVRSLGLMSGEARLMCRRCHEHRCAWKQIGELRIPLAVCKSCLISAAPFVTLDSSIQTESPRDGMAKSIRLQPDHLPVPVLEPARR